MFNRRLLLSVAVFASFALSDPCLSRAGTAPDLDRSVVMIRCIQQDFDYVTPWRPKEMTQIVGSGLIIEGNQILTNAHNISNARYIELKKESTAQRYPARVVFAGHDCDLAILAPEDPSFFVDTEPLELAGIPKVNSTVTTVGFPLGGSRLSMTEGVVSRIETDIYVHSGAQNHLVIQTDAAINPGNSGGPVVQNGKVVGIAFQGISDAENVGYMIPTTVIRHFLEDVEDGTYDGFGSLGLVSYGGLHSASYKDYLQVPANEEGVVVIDTLMHSAVENVLRPGDVVTKIDDYNIDNDGMIRIYGLRLHLSEVIETKQIGENADLTFYRQGKPITATATVQLNPSVLEYERQYDKPPSYVSFGGLVFVPATRNYLESWGRQWHREIPFRLRYLLRDSRQLNTDRQRKEYVVLSEIMPDEVNTYAISFRSQVVESINDKPMYSLADVHEALADESVKFYNIRFMGRKQPLPIDAEKARGRNALIMEKYHISSQARLE